MLSKFLERTWSGKGIGDQTGEREQRVNAPLSAKALRQLRDVMSGYVERGEVPGLVTNRRSGSATGSPRHNLADRVGDQADYSRRYDDTVAAKRPITVRDSLTFQLGLGLLLAPPDSHPIVKAMYERQVV